MRKLSTFSAAVAITGCLALAGCSDPNSKPVDDNQSGTQSGAATAAFDVTTIEEVPDIAAMVPESIKSNGVLRNGASTDYAPAEFRDDDGQTPIGYDIDMVKALARVMGLEDGTTQHAEFPTIIPALGSKFDVGVSSFTITPERLEQVNMVSYAEVGSAYAVAKGNPTKFDPTDVCGTTIGVQNGTYQFDYANTLSEECVAAGKDPVKVMPHDLQTDVTTKVVGGQYDATFADSTVVGFAVKNSSGSLEQVGEVIEAAPQGVAIAKDDEQLTAAIQAALQYLMDQGYLEEIMGAYGAESAALSNAVANPNVSN